MPSHSWIVSERSGERIPNCDLDLNCECGYRRRGLTANVVVDSNDSQLPIGECSHGVRSPNRFRYCPVCRYNVRAHY
jgi:hypothetical protein